MGFNANQCIALTDKYYLYGAKNTCLDVSQPLIIVNYINTLLA